MDNRVNINDLFSRSSTPPIQQSQHQQHFTAPNPHFNEIDSLFQNLSASSDQQTPQQQPSSHVAQSKDEISNSAPVTPSMSLTEEPSNVSASASSSTAADRQSALLSLLGGSSSGLAARSSTGTTASLPQQVPTPPGSSQRSNASPINNEAQGKILLEQLMSGNTPRSNYPDTQKDNMRSQPAATSSPPYTSSHREIDYSQYNHHDQANEGPLRPPIPPQSQSQLPPPPPPPPPQQMQQSQQQVTQHQQQPSSPRRSMFDFVSPFDHLSTSTGSVKKKPVPPQPASISSGNEDSSSWTAVSDPKRQSVENLLEHLTRGPLPQPPPQPPVQAQAPAYESYLSSDNFSQEEPILSRAPPQPLLSKQAPNRTSSPRSSPPKPQRLQGRSADSPASQQAGPPFHHNPIPDPSRRSKESSPGPGNRGGIKPKGNAASSKFNNKSQLSPSPQPQTIIFDVSSPLDDIQAPRDSVKSTAIALVRQDSVFLPGTTIGATHWVAYAMTRGRVRVISRSSGDRTLLQLPPVFPPSASVTDMAVYGNRLAGVTSDGGFVVWELPEVITDDVPGLLLLCVTPAHDIEALHSVKWHPKDADTVAVASDSKIYAIDLANPHALHGQPISQPELQHISQTFTIPSALVAFDFDVPRNSLASISEDSTLIIWNMHDKLPYMTYPIRGEDTPSSLTFVDGGLVVGRKNGTIFQLLSTTSKAVLSTIKFVNSQQEDNDMFGHVAYDSRIQTLWVANCRRDSMIAFKINLESSYIGTEEIIKGYFEQVVEFGGPKPTIHFVILTPDADPHGDEAHAACVAAKIPSGEIALVAFSVHSSGVDQILIRKEWYNNAFLTATAKFPPFTLPQTSHISPMVDNKAPRQLPQTLQNTLPIQAPPNSFNSRSRTPPSDVDIEYNREEGRFVESKNRKNRTVNWKEKEEGTKEKDKVAKPVEFAGLNESSLGQVLSREMKKTEENLHVRLGRLIGKEMDKQNQRLEEARAHEQVEDFARQEKILKLISSELTTNTTRVVEMAVKSEVQNSVLPSLENITKMEVKAALNSQVGRGLIDVISQNLPIEIEKLLLRPDISNHFAHILSSNLTPLIERHVKDAVAKSFIPMYSQQSSALHQELVRELRNEILSMKAELNSWQNDAFRTHEASIRELELSVRALSEQVKFLSMNNSGSLHHLPQRTSPVPPVQGPANQSHIRSQNLPPQQPPPSNFSHNTFQQPPAQSYGSWFAPPIAAPQASHPATIPQPPQTQTQPERSPPLKPEQWDELYLSVLHTQDATKLRDLLSRSNPDIIMPMGGQPLVSQAVILTLVHRLSAVVGETPPTDEAYKPAVWWLQRSASLLRPEDKLIADFIPRVIPNVQHLLTTTKQRLSILPGGPNTLETINKLTEVQDTLRRKVTV